MILSLAQNLAERIIATMDGYIVRAEIAGSIRRQKAEVKDIEIVAIPQLGQPTDLFEESRQNLLYRWAQAMERGEKIYWIKPGTNEIIRWPLDPQGKYWRGLLVKSQVKLDLFLTTKETWGCTFLIRTGPADYSHKIVGDAQFKTGHRFAEGKLFDKAGNFVPTPEEDDVYAALGLFYQRPEQRQ